MRTSATEESAADKLRGGMRQTTRRLLVSTRLFRAPKRNKLPHFHISTFLHFYLSAFLHFYISTFLHFLKPNNKQYSTQVLKNKTTQQKSKTNIPPARTHSTSNTNKTSKNTTNLKRETIHLHQNSNQTQRKLDLLSSFVIPGESRVITPGRR